MFKQLIRPAAGVLAGALLLAGCGADEDETSVPLSVYGNTWTLEIAPVLLAAEEYYEPHIEVKLGGIPSLVGAPNAFKDGDAEPADLATHADTQLLRYSLDHPNVRVLMTVAEGHYRIVARRSAGIESLADLEGKRIGTLPETSSHYFLTRMLKTVELTDQDLEIVTVRPLSDLASALKSGKVDAVTIWEPEIENAAHAIGDDLIEFSGDDVYRERFNLHSTEEKLNDPALRAEIVRFVRATLDAAAEIREDNSTALPLVVDKSGFDEDLVARSWKHQSYPGYLAADLLDVLVEEEIWLAEKDGRTPRTREELATLIDDSIVKEALALP